MFDLYRRKLQSVVAVAVNADRIGDDRYHDRLSRTDAAVLYHVEHLGDSLVSIGDQRVRSLRGVRVPSVWYVRSAKTSDAVQGRVTRLR